MERYALFSSKGEHISAVLCFCPRPYQEQSVNLICRGLPVCTNLLLQLETGCSWLKMDIFVKNDQRTARLVELRVDV